MSEDGREIDLSLELLDEPKPLPPSPPPLRIKDLDREWRLPKDFFYPEDAVQCDECGGNGCEVCEDRGWLPKGHEKGRKCYNPDCDNPIPPSQVAVYCSNKCALEDA